MNQEIADPADGGDLGFSYRTRKNGDVEIRHNGRLATTLRGDKARDFVDEVEESDFAEGQEIMARLTGNYKRGNERTARNHPRNRF
ncbi:MAG: hypothetical protein KDD84_08435 [Caldilineaceae bacterium]|nr:hypothetical protein [Caldilineaceae bacterium]